MRDALYSYLKNGHRIQLISFVLTMIVLSLVVTDIVQNARKGDRHPLTLVDGVQVVSVEGSVIRQGDSVFVQREVCNSSKEDVTGVVSTSIQKVGTDFFGSVIEYPIPSIVHLYPTGCHRTSFVLPLPDSIPPGTYHLVASVDVPGSTQAISYVSSVFVISVKEQG